jgi:gluconolactonase
MFYIDTTLQRVDKLDVVERDVINRRPFINFPESMGMPDGMSVDSDGNLWVAFWTGSAVRCFDGENGKQLDEISCPTPRITSCVFAGENLDQLIITSAREENEVGEPKEAGMTFIANPGVSGQKTTLFGA